MGHDGEPRRTETEPWPSVHWEQGLRLVPHRCANIQSVPGQLSQIISYFLCKSLRYPKAFFFFFLFLTCLLNQASSALSGIAAFSWSLLGVL